MHAHCSTRSCRACSEQSDRKHPSIATSQTRRFFLGPIPNFFYTTAGTQQLRALYLETLAEEERPTAHWDLSVDSIRVAIAQLDELEPKKEELCAKLQKLVDQLSSTPAQPRAKVHDALYQIGLRAWMDTLDRLFAAWTQTRATNGLPELKHEYPDPAVQMQESMKADSRKKDVKKGGKVEEVKPKGGGAVKEPKAATVNRTNAALSNEGGTDRPGSGAPLHGSQSESPVPDSVEVIAERRVHTELRTLTYDILCEMTDRVVALFDSTSA